MPVNKRNKLAWWSTWQEEETRVKQSDRKRKKYEKRTPQLMHEIFNDQALRLEAIAKILENCIVMYMINEFVNSPHTVSW